MLHVPENDDLSYVLIQCPELPPVGLPSLIHIKPTYKISENAIGKFFVKTPPSLEEYPPCLPPYSDIPAAARGPRSAIERTSSMKSIVIFFGYICKVNVVIL